MRETKPVRRHTIQVMTSLERLLEQTRSWRMVLDAGGTEKIREMTIKLLDSVRRVAAHLAKLLMVRSFVAEYWIIAENLGFRTINILTFKLNNSDIQDTPLHQSVFQCRVKIMYGTIRHDAIRYDTIRYDTIRYDTIRHDTIRYDTTRYNTTRYDTMRHDTTRCDTMRYDTTRYDTMRYDTIRHDTMRYDAIRYDTIRYDTMRHDTTRYDTTRYDTTRHDAIRCDTMRHDTMS